MSEPETGAVDTEARRAALEIVATLVHVKKLAADRLLRPAGIAAQNAAILVESYLPRLHEPDGTPFYTPRTLRPYLVDTDDARGC